MDPTVKPPCFGESVPEVDKDHHVQKFKPSPPIHSHYKPEAKSSKDSEDANKGANNASDLHGFTIIERPKDGTDFGVKDVFNIVKSLDVNRYATKKTIAQGMLDIALLTANASQLKYILQVGKQHEFYTLMLTLICTSIALQILSGIMSLSLNLLRDRRMEDSRYAFSVEWMGRSRLALSFIVFLDNIMIAAFDPMGLSSLLAYDGPVVPGIICVLLGSTFNINKTQDQPKANVWNNVSLAMMVLTVAVNVIISAFDMRGTDGPVKNGSLDDHDMLKTGIR